MARLIDADAFAERMLKVWDTADEQKRADIVAILADLVTPILVSTPTVDAVEVVRCKDCKHATFYSCKNDACYRGITCEYRIGIGDENFFCSYGERKDTDNG